MTLDVESSECRTLAETVVERVMLPTEYGLDPAYQIQTVRLTNEGNRHAADTS
jgi:hypothetical protein